MKSLSKTITTQLLRTITGTQQTSTWHHIVELSWFFGAVLVIGIYIVIPVLIVSQQLHLLFDSIIAAICLSLAQLIISFILWQTGHPKKMSSASMARRRQPMPQRAVGRQAAFSRRDAIALLSTMPLGLPD